MLFLRNLGGIQSLRSLAITDNIRLLIDHCREFLPKSEILHLCGHCAIFLRQKGDILQERSELIQICNGRRELSLQRRSSYHWNEWKIQSQSARPQSQLRAVECMQRKESDNSPLAWKGRIDRSA